MKALLLISEESASGNSEFYLGLHKEIGSVDLRRLGEKEMGNLKLYFAHHVDPKRYDCLVLHLDFMKLFKQARFLRSLDNVIFFDSSSHLDDISHSAHYQLHIKFYKRMLWARIIVSCYRAMERFQSEGLDAWCVPRGYNSLKYYDTQLPREIEMALIENCYTKGLPDHEGFIATLKKHYPEIYIEDNLAKGQFSSKLSKVRIAVCADIGLGEYRRKVFESMASGCLVMSYNQGRNESAHLGLLDMENIVLFNDFEDFHDKLQYLYQYPDIIEKIAREGKLFAELHHKQSDLGRQAAKYFLTPLRKKSDFSFGVSAFGVHL